MGADISASPGGRLPLMVRGLCPAVPLSYRLPEGKPVWTAVSESFNPASSSEVVEDLIRVIGKRLRSEGLLPGP